MHFVTSLPFFADWKSDNYNSILVIVDCLTKIVYYKPVKIIINAPRLAKVITDMLVWHYSISDSIINDRKAIFTSKYWFLLCYFFNIKR